MTFIPAHKRLSVTIDGEPNTLTFGSYSGARGYQYLTQGNASSHAFSEPLRVGDRFRTNGHDYHIIKSLSDEWMQE